LYKKNRPLYIFITMQIYSPPIFTDQNRLSRIKAALPEIEAQYKEFAESNHAPGYAFGLLVDGQLVHSGAGGFINLEKKIAATPQSFFRIASMTKSFTALAILKLRDENSLRLEDPIYLYLPEMQKHHLTQDAPLITIRDLLVHAAGFPTDDPWADRNLDNTEEDLSALLKKEISFSNTPGITFEYSNLGYTLLGLIIKKITGLSYASYIAKNLWQPLGMQAFWEYSEVPPSQLAMGYTKAWQKEAILSDGIYGAMGGMITSVEAFSRYIAWHQAAWPPRNDPETGPIKRSSLREAHRPWMVKDPIDVMASGYGYGLNWVRDKEGRICIGHSGGLPGFGSNWWMMPDYGLALILLTNVTYAPAAKENLKILDQLIETAELKPRAIPPSPLLKKRQNALLKLLPEWEGAAESGIFAHNFFLDFPLDALKAESRRLFASADITSVEEMTPNNQLSGSFILKGKNRDLQITLALSPENPALIQHYTIKESGMK
jgi:CubicO group peptidase (beta-lactamase class C family)